MRYVTPEITPVVRENQSPQQRISMTYEPPSTAFTAPSGSQTKKLLWVNSSTQEANKSGTTVKISHTIGPTG